MLILEAEHLQIAYGLRLPTTEFTPDLGEAQRARCLRALALYGVQDD